MSLPCFNLFAAADYFQHKQAIELELCVSVCVYIWCSKGTRQIEMAKVTVYVLHHNAASAHTLKRPLCISLSFLT